MTIRIGSSLPPSLLLGSWQVVEGKVTGYHPAQRNLVLVQVPAFGNTVVIAQPVMPAAHHNSGCWFPYKVDDAVLIGFRTGTPTPRMYILGAFWDGTDKPPGDTDENVLRFGAPDGGHTLRFTEGGIEITHRDGVTGIVISEGTVTISAKVINLVGGDGKTSSTVSVEAGKVSAVASGSLTLKGQTVDVDGGTKLTLDAQQIDIG